MRKIFSIILILVVILLPINALASPAPLASQGRAVFVPDDVEAEFVSLNISFRIWVGFTSVNTSMVLKNPHPDEAMQLRLGIPVHINNGNKIRELSISSGGKPIKAIQRSSLKNPPTEREVTIKSWYAFDLNLEPGESQIVDCSFAFDNLIEPDGSETLSYPLGIVRDWGGDIKNIQIVVNGDDYPPYAFEPMPSLSPKSYHDVGRLTFILDGGEEIPDNFELTLKPMNVVLTQYMDTHEEAGEEIKAITSNFRDGNYTDTLAAIHELMDESQDTPLLHEIRYIEALCYQNLFELDKALALFNQLEPDPGFGGPLTKVVKNKIAYDTFSIYNLQSEGDQALEYLNSMEDLISDDSVFSMWARDTLTLLAPPISQEQPEEEDDIPEEQPEDLEDEDDKSKIIDKITLGKYEFYIEEVFVATIVLILLIFIIIRIIKRRRRRRSSIFRY